ncbi:MAG: radical SAM protein [Ghiorsea sp.]|nr:radical SAM protein [Ghiorsea sp.]
MKPNYHIQLTTLNARYSHSAIGLRYLYANMQGLREYTFIHEFTINDAIQDVAEKLLECQPNIIGIGVYIWNVQQCAALVHTLKKVSPSTIIILGGPEVSYAPMRVNFDAADYIVQGEGDLAFYQLVQAIQGDLAPTERVIQAPLPDINTIVMPYDEYTDEDVSNRYIYVEASRGCPFQCEFCLSSRDEKVRNFDTALFLEALEKLWQRGVRNFKFIDRTFNLNIKIATQLLDFFLSKNEALFVHFEVIPDHFPAALKERMTQFSPATLQLEIGIQTLNLDVAKNIHRNLKLDKIYDNIRFLAQETSAHMHLDLIVGLPDEDLQSFGQGLDTLVALTDAEIQIGILKKLAGTTLNRHDQQFEMIYSDIPPYDILRNSKLSFEDIQKMKRFARFWNLYYNSGNFTRSIKMLWQGRSVFESFFNFSLWVYAQSQSTWKISLERLAAYLFEYRVKTQGAVEEEVALLLLKDLLKLEGRKVPNFLKPFAYADQGVKRSLSAHQVVVQGKNQRQQKRLR